MIPANRMYSRMKLILTPVMLAQRLSNNTQTLRAMASEPDVWGEGEQASLMASTEATHAAEAVAGAAHAQVDVAIATAVLEATEDDEFQARLRALEAFATGAAAANAASASAFRGDRLAELTEEGRKVLEEAAAVASELGKAFAAAAGETQAALLQRMQALQALSLQAERTLAQLRMREAALAEGMGEAEAAKRAMGEAAAAARAALESAEGEEAMAEARLAVAEAEAALSGAEARSEAERAAMQANLAARAEAREREAAASEARRARIERLRRVHAERALREEAASLARIAGMQAELEAMQAMADAAQAEAAKALLQRKAAEEKKAAERLLAQEQAEERRALRKRKLLAARLRKAAADNIFLKLAAPASEVAFVVDRSGSMTWCGVWVFVVRQLEQVLGALDGACRFRLIAFNEGVNAYSRAPVDCNAANRARALAWLERLEVIGGCSPKEDFGKPLSVALGSAGTDSAVKQVFLVSDTDGKDYEAALEAARARGVQVNCLYMCPDGRPVPLAMTTLARATGGHTTVITGTAMRTPITPGTSCSGGAAVACSRAAHMMSHI